MAQLPDEWQERTVPESTTAAWPSRCGWCDEGIEVGDPIRQVDGEWVHEECAQRAEVPHG